MINKIQRYKYTNIKEFIHALNPVSPVSALCHGGKRFSKLKDIDAA